MGDHSSPPFAPGSMNTPSGVGWLYMFCCGTNAAERRISLPVAASNTYTNPVLPASTTAFFPPTMAMTGGLTASRSHTSCGTSWYPHLNLPLTASIATIDSVQRLSPGRIEPSKSGDGLPIASGAFVSVSRPWGPSPTWTALFPLPVAASSARSSSSSVPKKTAPPETATPRLLGPQHAVETGAFLCVYSHNIFCVRRSKARTMLFGVAGDVMYMVPLTTIGVVSKLPRMVEPWVYTARGTRFLTFAVLIVLRGEKRLFQ